jgi:hypothetical protein
MIPAILIDMHYMVYRSHHIEQITSAFTKEQWIKIKTLQLSQDEPSHLDSDSMVDMVLENIDSQSAANNNNNQDDDRQNLRRRRLLRRRQPN